jgi:hypothetical protein
VEDPYACVDILEFTAVLLFIQVRGDGAKNLQNSEYTRFSTHLGEYALATIRRQREALSRRKCNQVAANVIIKLATEESEGRHGRVRIRVGGGASHLRSLLGGKMGW